MINKKAENNQEINFFKIAFYSFLILGPGLFIGRLLLLCLLDPLGIVYREKTPAELWLKETRIQGSTVIRDIDFDSVILGTSLASNMEPQLATEYLSGNFVNLSFNAAYLSERALFLEHILETKRLSTVIISLDGFGIPDLYHPHIDVKSYDMLLNANLLDNYFPYLSESYNWFYTCYFRISNDKCNVSKVTKNKRMLAEWATDQEEMAKFGNVNFWKRDAKLKAEIMALDEAYTSTQNSVKPLESNNPFYSYNIESFESSIFTITSLAPDTQFYLFFPPMSIVKYAHWYHVMPERFAAYIHALKSVVLLSEGLDNVTVFGFDDPDIINRLENYKDTGHYHPDIGTLILAEMGNGNRQLSFSNIDNYINKFNENVKSYDLRSFYDNFNRNEKNIKRTDDIF